MNGDLVTIHNIRNFDYRTETDFTPRYYDKTFDLRQLDSVDVIASYWMGDAIAHIFLSFGFAGKDFLAISIETRRERHESYSTVAGFFKQYELYYVVADERDLIGLRTNYRKDPPEDVYLYRTTRPTRQCAPAFSRLHTGDQLASRKTRVLQRAYDQLHDQHSDAYSGQPGRSPSVVESSPQRLYSSISL